MFYLEVAKIDRDVAHVVIATHVCYKCMFQMFQLFSKACCKYVFQIFQLFDMDVACISSIYCTYYSDYTRML